MKRWSKLQTRLYNLMDRSDNFQIHCVKYRMPKSQSHHPFIPRYYITIGKGESQKIIWDFPKDFPNYQDYLKYEIEAISDLIAEYCNTPRNEITKKQFKDPYGLVDVLRKYDRRFKCM